MVSPTMLKHTKYTELVHAMHSTGPQTSWYNTGNSFVRACPSVLLRLVNSRLFSPHLFTFILSVFIASCLSNLMYINALYKTRLSAMAPVATGHDWLKTCRNRNQL
jgi:hypothetical protein